MSGCDISFASHVARFGKVDIIKDSATTYLYRKDIVNALFCVSLSKLD